MLASRTFYAVARMSCGLQLFGFCHRVHVAEASISSDFALL
ncbi:hypothetical protein UF75_0653 [Desulfosporosinus sp. I2]|nr:hypothetical protein UF75_0653 [Desulfosporosinus sp. I2]